MSAKVSIVVRTKDRPLLLERALGSVLAQTMTDLEAIVVNDGGDGVVVRELVQRLTGGSDARIAVVDNDGRPGRAGALDAGVERATGTYFAIHDDDDAWHPEFLARTCAHLDEHPDDAAVATHTDVVFEEIADGAVTETSRVVLAPDVDVASFVETLWANYIPPIAMLLRRDLFDTIGPFDPDLPVLEDWEFNLRMMSRHTVGFVTGESLAYWHQRQSSTGADGNSVVADARDHEMFNLLIRDDYLRSSIAQGNPLGPLMAAAMMIRRVDQKADAAWAQFSTVYDEMTRGQRDHLSLVSQNLSLEIGRLRGEVKALRESISRDAKRAGKST